MKDLDPQLIELLKELCAALLVLLGWYLGRVSLRSDVKRLQQVKYKKLLFNLMELRYWIEKELSLDAEMERIVSAYGREVIKTMSVTPEQFAQVKPLIIAQFKNQAVTSGKMTGLETPIETVVQEIAEIDPVFAFELTGRYQISAIINALKTQLEKASLPENESEVTVDVVINDFLRPPLLKELRTELTHHISIIAKMIGKKTHQQVIKEIARRPIELNEIELKRRMTSFVRNMALTKTDQIR